MLKKFLFIFVVYFICIAGISAYNSYNQGDIVTYNQDKYYVLYNSDSSSNILTLLKSEPLTVDEVTKYGIGHINNYYYENICINFSRRAQYS